ncbi:MAG: hypothetical protein IJG52_08195 [Lachnospiraceae bacterium]|nr:hypothetical protein [Lachnospiraceae bacterium]
MRKERIVSIRALMRRILEKWRWMLLFGLLFAVLAAGYKAVGLRGVIGASGQAQEPETEETVAAQDAGEEDVVSYGEMDLLNTAFDDRNTYIGESLLFRINPAKEGRASFLLRVQVPEEEAAEAAQTAAEAPAQGQETAADTAAQEQTGAQAAEQPQTEQEAQETLGMSVFVPRRGSNKDGQILYVGAQDREETQLLKSYLSYIAEGIDWTALAEEFHTRPQYVQELVEIEEYPGLSGARVTVICEDVEGAQKILSHIKESAQAYTASLTREQGAHDLLITEEKAGVVVDADMKEWLVNEIYSLNNLYTYKTTLERSTGGSSGAASGAAAAVPVKTIVKILAKFGIFGFILGIILFAGCYGAFLLLGGRVLSGKEFNTQFDLKRIAVFPVKTKKNPIDRLIAGIGSGYETSPDRKVCLNVAAETMRALVGGRGTVAVISDLPQEMLSAFTTRLNAVSRGSSVRFAPADIAHSPEGISALCSADAAVIVAQCGRSRYEEAGSLLETAEGAGTEILGSIVI